jgi:hypothetical protein
LVGCRARTVPSIRNYVDAAAAVRSLKHPQAQFDEVIAARPVRRDTWAKFVVARAIQCLDEQPPSPYRRA